MDAEKLKRLVGNFKQRNIAVEYFESLEDVKSHIFDIVPVESTIGIGHSATLQKVDITNSLLLRGNVVYDKELAKNRSESKELKRKALTTDWYITGSNAISVDGRIVNIDHSGNRVAAITYGPDKVIIVVGKNKVVDTVDEAIKRVKNVACPTNAKRAGYNPPCVTLNYCVDCVGVCNIISIIGGQTDNNRIKIFIVNEECGF